MSLKIERDTYRRTGGSVAPAPSRVGSAPSLAGSAPSLAGSAPSFVGSAPSVVSSLPPSAASSVSSAPQKQLAQFVHDVQTHQHIPGTTGRHPVSEAVGTALTGGRAMSGTKGYLAAYIKQLEDNPMRTKMLTAGLLAGSQELLASFLAKDRNKHGDYMTARVPKMAAYGALVSAPMGHFLIWCLQKAFHGRKSLRAKILQILVSNLIIAPIQNSVYLVAMALIAGARTLAQVRATVRVGFWKVMRVTWISSPLCLAFAQQFLPESLWMPFFNLVSFIIGTYINTITKKKRLHALRKKYHGGSSSPHDYRSGPAPGSVGPSQDYPPSMSGAGPRMESNPHY